MSLQALTTSYFQDPKTTMAALWDKGYVLASRDHLEAGWKSVPTPDTQGPARRKQEHLHQDG